MADFDIISTEELVPYPEAMAFMEQRVAGIVDGAARECLWFLQHPPLYTAGTSANETDLLNRTRFPVYAAGRGGAYTYHGPGQRVVYTMLDLRQRGRDVRQLVWDIENWVIAALGEFGIDAHTTKGQVGIWVGDEKIGAIGLRVRRWVSFHGVAINVCPNLEHFSGIVPCGIADKGITDLHTLCGAGDMGALDAALLKHAPDYLFTQKSS